MDQPILLSYHSANIAQPWYPSMSSSSSTPATYKGAITCSFCKPKLILYAILPGSHDKARFILACSIFRWCFTILITFSIHFSHVFGLGKWRNSRDWSCFWFLCLYIIWLWKLLFLIYFLIYAIDSIPIGYDWIIQVSMTICYITTWKHVFYSFSPSNLYTSITIF